MNNPRERELPIGVTHIADGSRIPIGESHMAVDRGGLLRRELHEVLNLVDGLPTMTAEVIALV